MKKLLTVIIVAAITLYGCNDESKPGERGSDQKEKVDTTKHLKDVVLEAPEKDQQTEEIATRRAGRGKPPKPGDPVPPPPPPPPPVIKNGCILIDFNGHQVTGTMWNSSGDFLCAPSGMNEDQEAWALQRVQAYFQLFSPYIIVTTDEALFNTYPGNKRMRCVVTTSWEWYARVGGVSYINSFNWYTNEPCFVFSSLVNFNQRTVADNIAHEVGHTFGNRHQSSYDENCVMISSYNYGTSISAPIMGASFNADTALWAIGPNSLGCTIIQNDTAVIYNSLRK